jgi:iron complex transport system permease protein
VALFLAIVLGVGFGTDAVSLRTAVLDPSSQDHDIVFSVRLPRVLLATLTGAGLSIVGVALQALLRNALAEPFVLGVSGGAALGATLAILAGCTGATLLGASLVPLAAFAGGIGATLLVHTFAASSRQPRGTVLLLAGVVVNSMASAAITFLKTLVAPAKAQELLFWLMGFLDVPSPASLVSLATYLTLGSAVLLYDAPRLNLLSLGDEAAQHLGVHVRAVETRTMLASSLIVGAVVSVTGLIGFVGLIVPHALRRVFGSDTRGLMPASLLLGGAALVLCDLVSRAAFRWLHTEVPVGAVTALIGGPLFLTVLVRQPTR